ncbi:MAG: hypothetical protein MJ097_04475 [Dorea sp.]|nr:hypothetical protein [Dorea sp.]
MKNVLRILLILAMSASLLACGGEKSSSADTKDKETVGENDLSEENLDNPGRVIKAMLESPNEELYEAFPIELGIGAEVEKNVMDEIYEKEAKIKENWQEAVGDCFAEPMFEEFYNDWKRIYFLGYADMMGSSIEITDISADELKDGIQHYHASIEMRHEEEEPETYSLEWRVIYNSKDPELIEKIELLDLDGFGDTVG